MSGLTNRVHEYCRLAIIIIATMAAAKRYQRFTVYLPRAQGDKASTRLPEHATALFHCASLSYTSKSIKSNSPQNGARRRRYFTEWRGHRALCGLSKSLVPAYTVRMGRIGMPGGAWKPRPAGMMLVRALAGRAPASMHKYSSLVRM